MNRLLAGTCLALSALLAGCGSETAGTAADDPNAGPSNTAPTGLTCPTGERVSTDGGYLAGYPDGVDDPEQLVEEKSTPEEPWVLVGRKAYVLRPDGTAFEVHDVVKGPKGWFLHGYEACAE